MKCKICFDKKISDFAKTDILKCLHSMGVYTISTDSIDADYIITNDSKILYNWCDIGFNPWSCVVPKKIFKDSAFLALSLPLNISVYISEKMRYIGCTKYNNTKDFYHLYVFGLNESIFSIKNITFFHVVTDSIDNENLKGMEKNENVYSLKLLGTDIPSFLWNHNLVDHVSINYDIAKAISTHLSS